MKAFIVFEAFGTGKLKGWVVDDFATLNGHKFVRLDGPLTNDVTAYWNFGEGAVNTFEAVTDIPEHEFLADFHVMFTMPVKVKLRVDANRDGLITFDDADKTTSDKPFVFWLNDDNDNSLEFDMESTTPDYQNGVIQSKRDLEDFARIWMSVNPGSLSEGTTAVLSWRGVQGNPVIKIYLAVESDGENGVRMGSIQVF